MPGLPVLDGDGMGRAFPEVQMSTFFIYGLDPSPGAIADDKGNVVVFKTVVDMYWLERFARHIAVDMGAGAGFATTPMLGPYVKKVAVPGTLTQALEVGRTILDARAKRHNVIERILDEDRRDACSSPARSRTCGANCAAASRWAKRG